MPDILPHCCCTPNLASAGFAFGVFSFQVKPLRFGTCGAHGWPAEGILSLCTAPASHPASPSRHLTQPVKQRSFASRFPDELAAFCHCRFVVLPVTMPAMGSLIHSPQCRGGMFCSRDGKYRQLSQLSSLSFTLMLPSTPWLILASLTLLCVLLLSLSAPCLGQSIPLLVLHGALLCCLSSPTFGH